MPIIRKNASMPALDIMDRRKSTPHGGLLLLEALCRRCNLWNQIDEKQFPLLVNSGLGARSSESIIAQLLFSLALGQAGLREAARLRDEPLLMRLVGLKDTANEQILSAWLAGQTETSLQELRRLNTAFVAWVLPQFFPAETDKKRNLIDVVMRTKSWSFSMATHSVSANGLDLVLLRWRTLAAGPFLIDGLWSINPYETENAAHFEQLVTSHRSAWKDYQAYFCSGDMPNAAVWRRVMVAADFVQWTAEISAYVFEDACKVKPDSPALPWKESDGIDTLARSYSWAYPQGEGNENLPGVALVARRKRHGGSADDYAFLVAPTMKNPPAQDFFSRHFQKASAADQVLDGFPLNQVVCLEENARAAYSAIVLLAHNLLTALRLFLMPDAKDCTSIEKLRGIITTPAVLSTSGNRDTLYLGVSPEWPARWRDFVAQSIPGAGKRPRKTTARKSETET